MTRTINRSSCEECGSDVVTGSEVPPEATDDGGDDNDSSDFCPNPDCPSNYALRGFHRTDVADYTCLVCGASVHPPLADLARHRASHSS